MLTCKLLAGLVIFSCVGFIRAIASSCEDLQLEVYERFGDNPNDIQTIVDRHNFYRQAIMDGKVPGQPKGVGLKYLKWDERLAEIAQVMADTCSFKQRSLRDPRFRLGLGQNIARGRKEDFVPNDSNWTAVVESWFNQYKQYHYKKHWPNADIAASYTQIVWGNTEYIGCGFNSHQDPNEDSRYPIEEMYVCLYGPRGNQIGKYPYNQAPKNVEREAYDYD